MPRKISLKKRIVILVSLVTFLTMSVIVGFDSFSLEQSVQESYVSQLQGIATAINARYEESRSFQDVQQIFDYIEYKNDDVLQLTLLGREVIMASTDRERIGKRTPANVLENLSEGNAQVSPIYRDHDGVFKVVLTSPLMEDGAIGGAIELTLDASENIELINERIRLIIIVGVSITLLLLVALWIIIRNMLIKPLMVLRQAAISVNSGQKYEDIELHASQEINEVASAFNDMVHKLEERYRELQDAMKTIQQAQNQLVESEKMVALGSLVAGVSHEINTPVGIGVTAASFLDEKTKQFLAVYEQNQMKRSDLEEYMKTVRETTAMLQTNLQRASELIKSFKQVAVDRSVDTKRTFNLSMYLKEVLISLQPNLKKTRHRVIVEGNEHIELFNDPGALSQIITNLIMNSLIHAYGSDDEGTISIDVWENEGNAVISYADDGKGMPEEVVKRIFEPFFTTNRGNGGTGLGMHIVYNLVTQSLGGTVKVDSAPGEGTRFTIQIPMHAGGSHE